MIMLSRIAESLFWLGRYIERAEGISRSLEVQYVSSIEEDEQHRLRDWTPVLNSFGQLAAFFNTHIEANFDNVVNFLVFDEDNENSVINCITQARENARGVRDMISKETWEILNVTYREIANFDMERVQKEGPDKFFHFLRERSYLFQGVVESTTFQGDGYQFMENGKFIERADQTARILDVKYHIPLRRVEDVGSPIDIYQWKSLLESVGAYEAYLKYYDTKILPIQIAELLIFNIHCPRSLIFCMDKAIRAIQALSNKKGKFFSSKAEQKLGKLYYQLAYGNIEEVFFNGLHEFLTGFMNDLISIGNEMNYSYFGHTYLF
ncbi:MAG: alpha-E domain-containing protein [Leptospiraceae bacterium]|nr:alpha-E domain-containing protein [Leptospiraceae bacterium]MCP5496172.1 alpha-E domain-containing protein [Leptospiraceae bacterium]